VTSSDDALREYVEAIEGTLGQVSGKEYTLSPREFALARGWQGAGIPLAVVLLALDEAAQREGQPVGLSFCRHRVERMMPGLASRGGHGSGSSSLPDVESLLDSLIVGLEGLASGRAGVLGLALERARDLRAFVSVANRPNWDYLAQKIGEIDAEVDASVLAALDPRILGELQEASARAVARHRGKVTPEALEAAAQRALVQRARERLGLPRSLSL
jgi:hypothetical protein